MSAAQAQAVVEFKFKNSPWPFWVRQDLVNMLNDPIKEIGALMGRNFMPRQSSRQHPYTPLDYNLALKNEAMGKRHWIYKSGQIKGNMIYRGYGFHCDKGFQIVDFGRSCLDEDMSGDVWRPWELV